LPTALLAFMERGHSRRTLPGSGTDSGYFALRRNDGWWSECAPLARGCSPLFVPAGNPPDRGGWSDRGAEINRTILTNLAVHRGWLDPFRHCGFTEHEIPDAIFR